MTRFALILALLTAGFAHAADRGDVVMLREGEAVDPALVQRILGEPQAPVGKVRSIRMLYEKPAAGAAQPVVKGEGASALALPVQFAFDSSDILPQARAQLDQLAEGLRQLPASRKVVIEGHTDATGTEAYNLGLSERRAEAVKRYLVLFHGFDEARFRTSGFGKSQLLNESDPAAPENRRVQFRAG